MGAKDGTEGRILKRFTETDKWRDPWFRKLPPASKLAFIYIVENCDNAGVWAADKELADFSIGYKIKWDEVLVSLDDRILVLECGDWLVKKFVSFQFGRLSEECKPHLQVLRLIEKHRVLKGYPRGIHTLEEKEKEKEQDKKGSAEGKISKARGTSEECKTFAVGINLPESDGEWFFDKCEGCGWKNDGKPIVDWKATFRAWKRLNLPPSLKQYDRSKTAKPATSNRNAGTANEGVSYAGKGKIPAQVITGNGSSTT